MRTHLHFKLAPVLSVFLLTPALDELHAQSTKIFVASYGNDANDGSRGAPKRNFQAAHDAVAAKGQIVVLDTAGYGALNINRSVAVTVPPGVNGFVTVTGTNNAITIAAGAGSVVSLRGLIIEGGGSRTSATGTFGFGIYVTSVGWLTVEDCTIRNFLDGLPFLPSNNNPRLSVFNTDVRNCRFGIDIQGILVSQNGAIIAGCRLENNGDALYVSGPTNGTTVNVDLKDSVIAHCDTGVHIGGYGTVEVGNCRFSYLGFVTRKDASAGGSIQSNGNNSVTFGGMNGFDSIRSLQ